MIPVADSRSTRRLQHDENHHSTKFLFCQHSPPHRNNCIICVQGTSIVVHAGARVRISVREGSPGCEDADTVLDARTNGWTCDDIVSLRCDRPKLKQHKNELLAQNPGADCVESTMRLESYGDDEVHFSLGHAVDNEDYEEYGCFMWKGKDYGEDIPKEVGYLGRVSV